MELGRLDKKKVPQVAGDLDDLQIRSRNIDALDLARPVQRGSGRLGINRANPVEDGAAQPEDFARDFVQVGDDVAQDYAAEQQEARMQARFQDDPRLHDIARQEAIDLRTQRVRRQQREKLGTSSYQRRIGEDGEYLGFEVTAETRIQALTQNINEYINESYDGVLEQRLQDSGYVEPKGFAQKAKALASKKEKARSSAKKAGSKEFDSIVRLRNQIAVEPNPQNKLKLKEDIIAHRNNGLRAIEKASSEDGIGRRGSLADIDLSEQMELMALYQSELNILDQQKGDAPDYETQEISEYAELLKEKIAETKEIVEKKEARRKHYDLVKLVGDAYESGEREFREKFKAVKLSLNDLELEKADIEQSCEADVTAFGKKELVVKSVTDEAGKVTFQDSIADKYKTILSMEFTSLQQFEATRNSFENMGKDIKTIVSSKSKSYKEHTKIIDDSTKAKEEIGKNAQLSEQEKEDQKKALDKKIEDAKKAIAVIEREMDVIVKYDFFRNRMNTLFRYYTNGNVAHIWDNMENLFGEKKISFANYDYAKVSRYTHIMRMDKLLEIDRGPEFYKALLEEEEKKHKPKDKKKEDKKEDKKEGKGAAGFEWFENAFAGAKKAAKKADKKPAGDAAKQPAEQVAAEKKKKVEAPKAEDKKEEKKVEAGGGGDANPAGQMPGGPPEQPVQQPPGGQPEQPVQPPAGQPEQPPA